MEERFVNYFAIIGLQPEHDLVVERFEDKVHSADLTPLERPYVGDILAHYPNSRVDLPFRNEILALCLPRGLRFCTQKDKREPYFHCFANILADGSRCDGCALTFYEEVTDPRICEAMHSLHTLHLADLTGANHGAHGASRMPNASQAACNGVPPLQLSSSSSHTLPKRGSKSHHSKRTSFYDSHKDRLYVTKCICLLTPLPVVHATDNLLKALYSVASSVQTPPLPIESYVYWLLYEIPLPPPGRSLKSTLLDKWEIVCQRPGVSELPFYDYSLREVISLIGLENLVNLYTCALLEHQILLCSKVLQRLMMLAESLLILLFPFRWQHVYVPILPYAQSMFLEAPLPYIMGIQYDDQIPQDILQSNVCLVDIDCARVELPEDVPVFPDRKGLIEELHLVMNDYTNMPDHSVNRKQNWQLKRMSRSFDDESSMLQEQKSNTTPHRPTGVIGNGARTATREGLTPLPLHNVLHESESIARVSAIARRAGVAVPGVELLQQELESCANYQLSPTCRRYFADMKFNNAFREIFLNRFVHIFYSYEHFVLGSSFPDKDAWVSNRDSMQNFDRASFLSDQPETYLPFLSAFLETQIFTTFVDLKIVSAWETPDQNLTLFDERLRQLHGKFGDAMVRTPTYEVYPLFTNTEDLIAKREESLDYFVPGPHELPGFESERIHVSGVFPLLNAAVFEVQVQDGVTRSPWKQRYRAVRQREQLERSESYSGRRERPPPWLKELAAHQQSKNSSPAVAAYHRNSLLAGVEGSVSPADIANFNWKFVEQLLLEAKAKTKRMLVEKLGREAIELGHTDLSITGLEENTLVASLCDLLERIWSHGLQKKQGKSAVWAHLLAHQELDKGPDFAKSLNSNFLAPALAWAVLRRRLDLISKPQSLLHTCTTPGSIPKDLSNLVTDRMSVHLLRAANFVWDKLGTTDFSPSWSPGHLQHLPPESPSRQRRSRPSSPDLFQAMRPLPTHIAYDLKNVLKMSEIKTDIGYARAFMRLALERQLLHKHLKTILSNTDLLKLLYKRYAFLRCEEEREQFLYHILSMNAVDYRCFTNTYTRTSTRFISLPTASMWEAHHLLPSLPVSYSLHLLIVERWERLRQRSRFADVCRDTVSNNLLLS